MGIKMRKQTQFMEISYESAKARLTLWDDGTGHVSGLYSRRPGHGHARAVMQAIIAFADSHQIPLTLDVQSYGPHATTGMSNTELELFYCEFGFVTIDDGGEPVHMRREPSSQK